jgi:hypothetical protein
MKCSAWIRTCVDVFDHPILDNGPFDRRSAWLWLIAKAARFDKRINHKGKPLEIKRGQLLAGRAFLADTWGWSEKQVRLFLDLLAADFMIEKGQSNGHYANVITICNYDVYQTAPAKKQPVEGPERGQCGASAGPVQGQTLTVSTDNTNRQTVANDELKAAFNGSTANMLADVARWMGNGSNEATARNWLAGMLSAAGQVPTAQAYQMLLTAQGSGVIIAKPLAYWSKTASTLASKAKAIADAPPKPMVPDHVLRYAKPKLELQPWEVAGAATNEH